MTARTPGRARRTAGLVVTFALALSLPGVGEAHHDTCTTQGSSDPYQPVNGACPEFSPAFRASVSYPYRNTPATIHVEIGQADHEATTLRWEAFLPTEWQFDTTIRPAQTPGGGVPTSCQDIYAADGSAPRAEAVGDGASMTGRVNDGSNGARQTRYWGRARYESNNNNRRAHTSQLVFWRKVGEASDLCLLMQTHTIASSTPAYRVVIPMRLERLAEPVGPYGWVLGVNLEGLAAQFNPTLRFSMTSLSVDLSRKTSGRWNLNTNGVPTFVNFSRAPRSPVQTAIGQRAFTCTNGADSIATNCVQTGHGPGMILQHPTANDTQWDQPLATSPFVVNLPPAAPPQPWAQITKAGETLLPGVGTALDHPAKGFGFTDGLDDNGNRLSMTWSPLVAGLSSGIEVAGYVVAVRKVTLHQSSSTDDEIAAGRVAYRRELSNANPFSISFDLGALPENAQMGTAEGKYDVALVTIYNTPFGNGYRSDGLCDGILSGADPSDDGRGVLCPTGRPIWLANGSSRDGGVSRFSVIARDHAWPLRYYMSADGQPFELLLLDPARAVGELTFWGATSLSSADQFDFDTTWRVEGQGIADQGASKVFRGAVGPVTSPVGGVPGLITFGSLLDLEGESFNWSWTGQYGPLYGATGQLVQYNARGGDLDWAQPRIPIDPNEPIDPDDPLAALDALDALDPSHGGDCELSVTVGCPSGTPMLITTDFDGVAF